MTVGEKIRYYRELNGFSKRELGLRAGFSFSTASVRISQYESEQTIPREEILAKIATALNVDLSALANINISNEAELLHVFFELENKYNLKIDKVDKEYTLRFEDLKEWHLRLQMYFEAWLNKQKQLDCGMCSKKEYDLWRGKFPNVEEVSINEEELKAKLTEKEKELEIQIEKIQEELERQTALLKAVKNKYSEV